LGVAKLMVLDDSRRYCKLPNLKAVAMSEEFKSEELDSEEFESEESESEECEIEEFESEECESEELESEESKSEESESEESESEEFEKEGVKIKDEVSRKRKRRDVEVSLLRTVLERAHMQSVAISQELNNEDKGSISEVIVVTSTNQSNLDQMLFEIEETKKKKAKISDEKMFEDFFLD
jgi:hypothetical protein